jgi:hypothetical protein
MPSARRPSPEAKQIRMSNLELSTSNTFLYTLPSVGYFVVAAENKLMMIA